MLVFGGVIPFLGPGALFVTQNSKVGKVSNPTLGDKVGSRIESPNRRHIFSGRRIFPVSLSRAEKEFGVADARTALRKPSNGHFGPRRYLTDLTLTRESRFSSRIEPWVVFLILIQNSVLGERIHNFLREICFYVS